MLDAWITHFAEILDRPAEEWPASLRAEMIFAFGTPDGRLFAAGYRKGLAAAERSSAPGWSRDIDAPAEQLQTVTQERDAARAALIAAVNGIERYVILAHPAYSRALAQVVEEARAALQGGGGARRE